MTRQKKRLTRNIIDALLLLFIGVGVGWLIGLSVSSVLYIILGSIIALVAGAVGALIGLDQGARDTTEPSSEGESKLLHSRKTAIYINPLPLTMLVIGLGMGSVAGIYARANGLFGPDPQKFAKKWAGTGLDEKKIQQRLFDQLYPPKGITEGSEKTGVIPAESEVSSSVNEQNSNESNQIDGSEKKTNTLQVKPSPPRQREAESPIARQLGAGLYSVSAEDCQTLRLVRGDDLRDFLKGLGDNRIIGFVNKCKDESCLEVIREMICQNTE